MKIGILQCDDVTKTLQEKHGNYPGMFTHLFESIDASIDIEIYRVIDGEFPVSLDECDAYVISGSRYGVNDNEEWIATFEHFVRQLDTHQKRCVGICFGHQMMAKALGGVVETSSKGWGVGVYQSQLVKVPEWVGLGCDDFSLVVSHKEQVTIAPSGAIILAASEFCPFAMMQFNGHFIGLQGHPEFSKSYSKDLMLARRDRIPAERIELGIESLCMPVDDKLVTRWLINFLKQA